MGEKYTFTPEDIGRLIPLIGPIKLVLRGDIDAAWDAFDWDETQQGMDHWLAIADGDKPLSADDRIYLQALLEAALYWRRA